MTKFLRILHLSDIHYSKKAKEKFEVLVKAPLFESLKRDNEEHKINFICLTGDLIDKGTGGFLTTEDAFANFDSDFIQPLCSAVKIGKDNIILSPGNHDINRNLDSKIDENGLRSILKTDNDVDEFITDNHTISKIGQGIKRIIPYKLYESSFYYRSQDSEITTFESSHIRTINGIKIGFVSLNSAWRCYNDESKIIIGAPQIISGIEKIKDCQLKILLSHYSLDNISEIERHQVIKLVNSHFQICCF